MSTAYSTEQLANGYSTGDATYTNGHSHDQSMDGRQSDYPQSDPASAAQYQQGPDVKFNPSATPTQDYGLSTSPTRGASQYPEYMQQRAPYQDTTHRYSNSGAQAGAAAIMAQTTNPSIAAPGQGYPQHHYAPYPAPHDAQHYQPAPGMYPPHQYGAPYPGTHGIPYGHMPPAMTSPPMGSGGSRPPGGGHPLSTVYSFVPIPGTHQQKRPRRRYEEIERMYKCGWNGCEKAYGTLNHLNAHVTMQTHGSKRTPEEFKEIRKEWKQRKKEEDTARKQEDERQRAHHPGGGPVDGHSVDSAQSAYQTGQMGGYYPQSPYGQNAQLHYSNENGSSGSGQSPS